jgi:hypothetical protein
VRHTIRTIALLSMTAILPAAALFAQREPETQAGTLFELANHERAAHGLPRLKWDEALAAAAQNHARRMARENSLSHQFEGEPRMDARAADAGAHFSLVAENIAEGPSLEIIHASWMGSKPHRENILDPQLDSVGIAVSERNGQLFAVQDFSEAVANLSIEQQEARIGTLLSARRLQLLTKTSDAEQTCRTNHAPTGKQRPLAISWFETPDLSSLPDSLEKRIQSGRYKSAMVAACPSNSPPGFTTYHIAVLLY